MTSSFLKVFGIITFFLCQSYADESCPFDRDTLPKCDSGSGLISEHKSSQIVFLPAFVNDKDAIKIMKAIEGTSTKLSLRSLWTLESAVGPNSPEAPLIQSLKEHNLAKTPDELYAGGHFTRDNFVFQFDSKKNKIKFFTNELAKEFEKNPKKFCGIEIEYSNAIRTDNSANLGGNVMVFPGGLCLTGDKMSPQVSKQLCGSNKQLSIDTSFTAISHLDEVINIVPDHRRAPPCDFSIVRSSSDKFVKALGNGFDRPFFKDLEALERAEKRNHCQSGMCYRVTDFCRLFHDYAYLVQLQKHIQSQDPLEKSESLHPKERGVAGRVESEVLDEKTRAIDNEEDRAEKMRLQIVEQDKVLFSDFYQFESEFKKPECKTLTNRDVALMIKGKAHFSKLISHLEKEKSQLKNRNAASILKKIDEKINYLELFKLNNQNFEKIQNANIEKIKKSLPVQCQSDNLTIEVPSLIFDGSSLNPNPANLTVMGKSVFYPEQFNEQIAEATENSLEKSGNKPESFNTFFDHTGKGNVHCLTNEFRLCKP